MRNKVNIRISFGGYCNRSDNVNPYLDVKCQCHLLDLISKVLCNRFVFKIKMPLDVCVQLINDMAKIEYVSIFSSIFLHLLYCLSVLLECDLFNNSFTYSFDAVKGT